MTQEVRKLVEATQECTPNLSFAKDIAPLFNATEIAHMKSVTGGSLDLSNYESVKTWAHQIYLKVQSGQMPPYPADPWTADMVNTFGCWIQQGCQP